MPSTFRITIAYDGTGLVGWQRQAEGVSVQGLLEDALAELDGQAVAVVGAGRTDAGVHALAQVAAFSLSRTIDPGAVVRALNVRLPLAVRVIDAQQVDPSFHPQFQAVAKTYRYRIWNAPVASPFERAYTWHVLPPPLDVDAMDRAAKCLVGRHDFAAFQGTGTETATTERDVFSASVVRGGESLEPRAQAALVTCEITGSGFLRHMVRTIAGTLVDIGRGKREPEWIADVIASRRREQAGRTAPAEGLFLAEVRYETAPRGAEEPLAPNDG